MRILLFTFLIFAISFSGLSTVAHAFDSQTHDKTMSVAGDLSINMDCAEHGNKKDIQEKSSKDSKHLCQSCAHCSIHYFAIPQQNLKFRPHTVKTIFFYTSVNPDDDILSGLKRPPKSLV